MNNSEDNKNFIKSPLAWWLSTIIALVGLGGFLYDHLTENNPNLTFTIIKETSLLNNNANIPSIHILLDSIDISETNSNLSIYTIKVENEGKQHITTSMYDGNIRLLLKYGEYISLPIVTYASSPHIKPHFTDSTLITNKGILNIPCIPMDKNDVYLFDVILLHPMDTLPSFFAYGKVSGQKEIRVFREINDKPSFWKIAFGGGFWVNVVRVIICFIFGLALLISIVLSADKIESKCKKIRLHKAIHKITSNHPVSGQVVDDFNTIDDSELRIIYKWVNTTDEEASKNYIRIRKKPSSRASNQGRYMYAEDWQIVKMMIQKGYLTLTNEKIVINKALQRDFLYVYKQLKEQKILNFDMYFTNKIH